jgi:hypothetical protein
MTLFKETPGEMGKPEAADQLGRLHIREERPDQGKSG